MKYSNENLAFVQSLLDAADPASAQRLLRERASSINGEIIENLILHAKNYADRGELNSAHQLATHAVDAAEIVADDRLRSDAQFIKAVVLQYGGYLKDARTLRWLGSSARI